MGWLASTAPNGLLSTAKLRKLNNLWEDVLVSPVTGIRPEDERREPGVDGANHELLLPHQCFRRLDLCLCTGVTSPRETLDSQRSRLPRWSLSASVANER